MPIYGFADLKDLALPSLWDLAEIKKIELADGKTFDQMVQEIQAGLQFVNSGLLGMPNYSGLFAVQDDVEVEYPIGVTNGFAEATEYGLPLPQRGATTGHSIPTKTYDRGLGWTMMYLRKARTKKLDADVRSVITDAQDIWQRKMLTRFFQLEGDKVGATANASVPFADAAATDTSYVPLRSPEGEAFDSTHSHYLRLNGINQANLETAVEHLQEHGHAAPFDLIVSRADISSWTNKTNVTGYKNPEWPDIVYHSSQTERANITEITEFVGYVETTYGIVRIWATPRLPTTFWGVYKTYGPGDSRNPLRVRFDPKIGFGFNIVPGMYVNQPVHLAVAMAEFGVGIGEDRTNGVCVRNDSSGDYTTPTIA